MFFVDFDMKILTDSQKETVNAYIDNIKKTKTAIDKFTIASNRYKQKLKEFNESQTPDKEKIIASIRKNYNDKKDYLAKLENSNGNTYTKKIVTPQEKDHAAEDRRFISFYSKKVEEAFASVYDLQVMQLLKSRNYLDYKPFLELISSPSHSAGEQEVRSIVHLSLQDELERFEERIEIEFENVSRMISDSNQIYNLKDTMIYKPLKKFKANLQIKEKERIKIISKKLSNIFSDYLQFKKDNPLKEEKDIVEFKEIVQDNSSEILKIKEDLFDLKAKFDSIMGKNLSYLQSEVDRTLSNYKKLLTEFDTFDISDIPYSVNKYKINIFLINIIKLNMFEAESFGSGYRNIKGEPNFKKIVDDPYSENEINTLLSDMRDRLKKIIENLPDLVTETDKIDRAMVEEMIVNNYQSDLSDKTHVDLFIDNEYLFKISFDWKQKYPELKLTKADKFFAIPNIIGTFEDFKILYERYESRIRNDYFKINFKLFQMEGKPLKSNLSDKDLKKIFNNYSKFVIENYDKIVESKFSSILKGITISHQAFMKNAPNQSVFINPIGRNKIENLYEHIPFGEIDSSNLINNKINDKYYNNLINYHKNIEVHTEKDLKKSVEDLSNSTFLGVAQHGLVWNLEKNINSIFDQNSSLLPLLESSNKFLKENISKTMMKNIKKYDKSSTDNIDKLRPKGNIWTIMKKNKKSKNSQTK